MRSLQVDWLTVFSLSTYQLFNLSTEIRYILEKVVSREAIKIIKIKAYEQLVLLGFAVTSFTPVAYQRHRL